MNSQRRNWILFIVMVLCTTLYAIVLQIVGQPESAERFISVAGGTLATLLVVGWIMDVL